MLPLFTCSPATVATNFVSSFGPTPVSIDNVVAFTWLSLFACVFVYVTSYPSFAVWLYSRFSGTSTVYDPETDVLEAILSIFIKYLLTSSGFVISCVHPFSGLSKSVVAFSFSV